MQIVYGARSAKSEFEREHRRAARELGPLLKDSDRRQPPRAVDARDQGMINSDTLAA